MLFLDGAYAFDDESPRFHRVSAPTQAEFRRLLHAIATRALEKQGLLGDDSPALDLEPADHFEQLLSCRARSRRPHRPPRCPRSTPPRSSHPIPWRVRTELQAPPPHRPQPHPPIRPASPLRSVPRPCAGCSGSSASSTSTSNTVACVVVRCVSSRASKRPSSSRPFSSISPHARLAASITPAHRRSIPRKSSPRTPHLRTCPDCARRYATAPLRLASRALRSPPPCGHASIFAGSKSRHLDRVLSALSALAPTYRQRTRQRPDRYSRNHRNRRFILPILRLPPAAADHIARAVRAGRGDGARSRCVEGQRSLRQGRILPM